MAWLGLPGCIMGGIIRIACLLRFKSKEREEFPNSVRWGG